jgi:hypothetical protein
MHQKTRLLMIKFVHSSRIPIKLVRKLLEAFLILTADEKILAKCPRELDINDLCGPDLSELQDHNLFALQLFHRWCLRVFIFSKYSINWPKSLNPVNHMKGGDEAHAIVKRIANMSDDSVEFLQEFVRLLSKHKQKSDASPGQAATSRVVSRPTGDCIRKINLTNGTFSLDWTAPSANGSTHSNLMPVDTDNLNN